MQHNKYTVVYICIYLSLYRILVTLLKNQFLKYLKYFTTELQLSQFLRRAALHTLEQNAISSFHSIKDPCQGNRFIY